jgi:hypothetical protein
VRRTAEFEIVECREPTIRERNAVMGVETGRLGATAFRPDKRAPIAVAFADGASQRYGNS